MSGSRICNFCGELTPFERLVRDPGYALGYRPECQSCATLVRTCRRYGITREDYLYLLRRQHGVCAICGDPPGDKYRLGVDHDHACCTGCRNCIRGLLCNSCNYMLGCAEHSAITSAPYAAYLGQRPLVDKDQVA